MKKIGSGKIIAILLVTVVLFIFLLLIQNAATKNVVTKTVIMTKENLTEGTVITKNNADKFLKKIEIESSLAPEFAIEENELWNKQFIRPISKNVIVTTNDVQPNGYKRDNYDNPTKTTFELANISNGIAGKLRAGQLITIDTIDSATNEDIEITSNAYITNVYDADGKSILNIDNLTAATIIEVIVSKKQVKHINEASSNGKIMVSIAQKGEDIDE